MFDVDARRVSRRRSAQRSRSVFSFGELGASVLLIGCANLSSEAPAQGDASASETGYATPDAGPAPAEGSSGSPDRSSGSGPEASVMADSRSEALATDAFSTPDARSNDDSGIMDPER